MVKRYFPNIKTNWRKYSSVVVVYAMIFGVSYATIEWVFPDVAPLWSLSDWLSIAILEGIIIGGYVTIRWYLSDVAPFWDRYDSAFAGTLGGILLVGYATFVGPISPSGLVTAGSDFIKHSGLLALLTAWTAIIGLYRLRHRPDKTRPAVRQDFKNLNEEDPTDFGLRNFGPGPALYIQAVVTVGQEQEAELEEEQEETNVDPPKETCFQARESPIHLREGDFASLVRDREDDWVSDMAEKYESGQREGDTDGEQETPMVTLYFSYVSQSGARTPTNISTERDDENVLDKIVDPDSKARRVELSRVVDACNTDSPHAKSPSPPKPSHR